MVYMKNEQVKNVFQEHGDEIIQMRLDGIMIKDIAFKFGLKVPTVSSFLSRNNIRKRGVVNNENIGKMIEMYTSGETLASIAKELHLAAETIREILIQNNIEIRKPTEYARKYKLNERYFDTIDTQDKAYMLGLLYADGNRSGSANSIFISLQERDKNILVKMKQCLDSDAPLHFIDNSNIPNTQNLYALLITSKHMAESLYKYGIVPCKEFKTTFPYFLDDRLIRHFIRGYLDGDGCIDKKYKRVILTGTVMLLSGVKEYLENKLGVHCTMRHYKNNITCDIQIAGNRQSKMVLDYLYDDANLYIERKYNTYIDMYYS